MMKENRANALGPVRRVPPMKRGQKPAAEAPRTTAMEPQLHQSTTLSMNVATFQSIVQPGCTPPAATEGGVALAVPASRPVASASINAQSLKMVRPAKMQRFNPMQRPGSVQQRPGDRRTNLASSSRPSTTTGYVPNYLRATTARRACLRISPASLAMTPLNVTPYSLSWLCPVVLRALTAASRSRPGRARTASTEKPSPA